MVSQRGVASEASQKKFESAMPTFESGILKWVASEASRKIFGFATPTFWRLVLGVRDDEMNAENWWQSKDCDLKLL